MDRISPTTYRIYHVTIRLLFKNVNNFGYPDNWTPWNWGGYQSCSVAASRAYEERIRQYQYQYSAAPFHPTDGTWAQLNTNLQNAAITYVNLCDNL